MNFFFIFFILAIMVISNKLFLFNEEFLILLSFSSFCFVIYNKLSFQVQNRFESKISEFEKAILLSLNLIDINLKKRKKLNTNFQNFKYIFLSLKNYYIFFSTKFLLNLLNYKNTKEKVDFLFKLNIFSIIEKDYFKFIIILLTSKLNQINNIFHFFSSTIRIKKFQTIVKINRLNLINKI